jgi:hypothetical protein
MQFPFSLSPIHPGHKGMYFVYWLALFSTAVCANIIGLNISAI